jgi:hypothetical protein
MLSSPSYTSHCKSALAGQILSPSTSCGMARNSATPNPVLAVVLLMPAKRLARTGACACKHACYRLMSCLAVGPCKSGWKSSYPMPPAKVTPTAWPAPAPPEYWVGPRHFMVLGKRYTLERMDQRLLAITASRQAQPAQIQNCRTEVRRLNYWLQTDCFARSAVYAGLSQHSADTYHWPQPDKEVGQCSPCYGLPNLLQSIAYFLTMTRFVFLCRLQPTRLPDVNLAPARHGAG